ncbi:hypothetical protein CCZ01_09090 [Helicobacter monodelphidis]|uniref:RluA family pseudouridine synthase n=1 Tax=Helicobacter sp. 15-1451 TaxID=2004995 RepID=UPI000DCE0BAA|nr:RluA family pseudouridine synthase [Helicobacter sp. 15-1451]RAX56573.1 hypothetical protein CCZ01_09090 [Helicobacter sp. 15-1451]
MNTQQGRLDKILSSELKQSRNQVEQLIKGGGVFVDGVQIFRPAFILKGGEKISFNIPDKPKISSMWDLTNMEIEILYEDAEFLVLNKPPFLAVHSAPSLQEATLCDWLQSRGFTLSTLNGEERMGIVHRLDKQTSGAIVVAKNNTAHIALAKQLESREMGRYYLALIDLPLKDEGMFECYMARNPRNRLKMAKCEKNQGRYSCSYFIQLAECTYSSLIAAKLKTGRTHQIRCHLEQLGRHILGDKLYGYGGKFEGRVLLHAYGLYLKHPISAKEYLFQAPIFNDMQEYLQKNCPEPILEKCLNLSSIIKNFNNYY